MADLDRKEPTHIQHNQPSTSTITTITTNTITNNTTTTTVKTSNTILGNPETQRDDNKITDVNDDNKKNEKEIELQDEQETELSATAKAEKELEKQVGMEFNKEKMDYQLDKDKIVTALKETSNHSNNNNNKSNNKNNKNNSNDQMIIIEEEQLKLYLKQELDKVENQKEDMKESSNNNNTGIKGLMLNEDDKETNNETDGDNNKNRNEDRMDTDDNMDINDDNNNNNNSDENENDENENGNEEDEEDEVGDDDDDDNRNGTMTKGTKRGKRTPYKTATAEQLDILVDQHINSKLSISAAARKAGIARSTAATLMKKYKLNQGHIPARRPRGRTAPPTLSSVHTQWIDDFLRQNHDATLSKIKQHLLIAHPSIPHISISALQRHISIKCEMNLKRARK
ncbi:unnamed protein product [Cunninghamella blakesleeana]